MMRPAALLVLVALALTLGGSDAPGPISGGRLGVLRSFPPRGDARAVVLWFGTAQGWSPADEAAARRLASRDILVAGVDLPGYLAALTAAKGACLYLAGDAEHAARLIERRFGLADYLTPLLAGVGAGGRLALATAAQAPPATLAGAAAVDPSSAPGTAQPICREPPADVGLPNDAARDSLAVASSRGGDAETALADLVLRRVAAEGREPATMDLPLALLPSRPGAPLAIVLSGDGGWRDIDKAIAMALHRQGYAVIGWDCLRYFWQARTPAVLGRDLARVISAYGARWHASRIALIGYSFGADVLPFAFNRLPAGLRGRIVQISLLGYAGRADFEIRVAGWFGAGPSEAALDGRTELARIDPRLIQCFYGSDEPGSACPRLHSGTEVIETAGGHHFGGDYAALARRIADGVATRSGAAAIRPAVEEKRQARPGATHSLGDT